MNPILFNYINIIIIFNIFFIHVQENKEFKINISDKDFDDLELKIRSFPIAYIKQKRQKG